MNAPVRLPMFREEPENDLAPRRDPLTLDEARELDGVVRDESGGTVRVRQFYRDTDGTPLNCPPSFDACHNVACRYHLDEGQVQIPGTRDPGEARRCTLDYAERDGMSLYEVAAVLGVTHQCVFEYEKRAVRKLGERAKTKGPWRSEALDWFGEGE